MYVCVHAYESHLDRGCVVGRHPRGRATAPLVRRCSDDTDTQMQTVPSDGGGVQGGGVRRERGHADSDVGLYKVREGGEERGYREDERDNGRGCNGRVEYPRVREYVMIHGGVPRALVEVEYLVPRRRGWEWHSRRFDGCANGGAKDSYQLLFHMLKLAARK